MNAEFDEFWREYPRKVGKLAALKAYQRARKLATPDAILAGLMSYKRFMPLEMQFVPHAATWLNAGRWMDEEATVARAPGPRMRDWYEECRELHGNACGLDRWKHMTRVQGERMERGA